MHTRTDTPQTHTIPACQPFPHEGKVRVKQAAPFLGIGISTFWLLVKTRRIEPPVKFGQRISVWDASYIRSLAENGIPDLAEEVD